MKNDASKLAFKVLLIFVLIAGTPFLAHADFSLDPNPISDPDVTNVLYTCNNSADVVISYSTDTGSPDNGGAFCDNRFGAQPIYFFWDPVMEGNHTMVEVSSFTGGTDCVDNSGDLATCLASVENLGNEPICIGSGCSGPPPPAVNSIQDLIGTSSYNNFGSTTGYDLKGILDFFQTDLLTQNFAVIVGFIYGLRWWIVVGLVFGGVLYFAYRAFRFFRH